MELHSSMFFFVSASFSIHSISVGRGNHMLCFCCIELWRKKLFDFWLFLCSYPTQLIQETQNTYKVRAPGVQRCLFCALGSEWYTEARDTGQRKMRPCGMCHHGGPCRTLCLVRRGYSFCLGWDGGMGRS